MQGISYDRRGDPRGLELVDGAVFDLTPEGVTRGRMLAGPGPLPRDAVILGHVGGCRDGALLRLANDTYVDYGAGVVRSLDQRAAVRAVEGAGPPAIDDNARGVVYMPRGPKAAVEAARCGENTFRHYMGACRALCSGDYRRGYEYGLRRHYHGERFGETSIIEKMLARGGDLAGGCGDGMAGRPPRDMEEGGQNATEDAQEREQGPATGRGVVTVPRGPAAAVAAAKRGAEQAKRRKDATGIEGTYRPE